MFKTSISLINNADETYIRSLQIDGIEAIANKTIIDNRVCSIQSLFYGLNCNFRIVDNPQYFIDFLKPIIVEANKIDANLVFGAPKLRSYNDDEKNKFVKFLTEINNLCDGAIFAIEPNADIYGGSNLFTTYETIDFIRELNLPNIKLNLDLGTAYYNNEIFDKDFINKNLDIINHIHISAPYLRSIQTVDINYYNNFLSELVKSDYNKFVSLESLEKNDKEIKFFQNLVYNYLNS